MPQHAHPHRRRRLATLVSLVTAATLLAGPTPSAVSAETVPIEKVPLRVGTYNIQANRSVAVFSEAVHTMVDRVDVLGLQEVNSKDKEAVLASLVLQGWSYYRPKPGEQSPILWDKSRFSLLSARLVTLAGRRWVGNERPGQEPWIEGQYATVVRLRDTATGQHISVVNTHLVAGAVKGGKRWAGRPRTFRLYTDSVKKLVVLARNESAWGRAFVMGDYNIGWVPDSKRQGWRLPYSRFRKQGMKSMWATARPANRGTRLTALLDQVYSTTKAKRTSVEYDVEFSDHWPAIATYMVPVA